MFYFALKLLHYPTVANMHYHVPIRYTTTPRTVQLEKYGRSSPLVGDLRKQPEKYF